MNVEWFLLLLPLAALSGWLSARAHYKQQHRSPKNTFNPEYFKGLNFLLNEQPDKAIDVFIKLLEVNSETVETHLALANLFRRRGETDRAIRIHQNLIARPTLTHLQRDQALVELGLDYMNAGVLDRAESLFLELLSKPSPPIQAYKQLLRIYQQEKNWHQAIEMAKNIQNIKPDEMASTIAQFYCELATQYLNTKHKAFDFLKQAKKHDPDCVRAMLLEADLYITAHNYRNALKSLLVIEQQNYLYIAEALPQLLLCYQQLNKLPAFEQWLQALLKRHPNLTSARLMLTHIIQLQHGSQAAQDYLYEQLHSYPSVEGLHTLISLGAPSNSVLVPLIRDITSTMIHHGDRYTCQHCGFSGKTMHWHCPSCKQWGTIKPTEIHLSSLETLLESH